MTNELGTTLQDIEVKAERKREALDAPFMDGAYKAMLSVAPTPPQKGD